MKTDTTTLPKVHEAEENLKAAQLALEAAVKDAFPPGRRVIAKISTRRQEFPVQEVRGLILVLDTGNGKTIGRAYDSVELTE